jgi:hypothetical protein
MSALGSEKTVKWKRDGDGRLASRVAVLILAIAIPASAGARDFEDSIEASSGGTLRIDLDGGSVEVETHGEDEVRVDAHAQGMGARSVDFELTGDGVDVEFRGSLSGFLGAIPGPRKMRVRVRVPETYSLDIRTSGGGLDLEEIQGNVRARTSGGNIQVDEIEGDTDLETSGGSVEASDIRGNLRIRTSGGRIKASEVTGDVDARTSGGPITIHDVEGRLDLRTSGGSIDARFTGDPAGHLETSGGSIEVEFPSGAGADLDAQTAGGRVEVEHAVTIQGSINPSHLVGAVNGGGESLVLRTSGGNIRIKER